jgi:hypothetical protein
VLPHAMDLVCKPILSRDDGNIGSVLCPHEVSLMEAVELRNKKRAGLLLLCIAVLLAASNTTSRTRLRLGRCSVLAMIVG